MPKIEKSNDGITKLTYDEGYQTIIIPSVNNKYSVCVSSQIGCPLGCQFCYTAKLGFVRNLSAEEILAQIDDAYNITNVLTSVIFMGMGEPMLNFDEVIKAIDMIHDKYKLSYKRITLSTVGINLDKLLNVKFRVAISLHYPSQKKRDIIIPSKGKILDFVAFSHDFIDKKDGVMIAYTLIKGENDSDEDLKNLLSYNWSKQTNFNLIEFNEIDSLKKSENIMKFKEAIREKGYKCFIRKSKGTEIKAACGMLDFNQ